ncbi:MerR family transcriptional regulator [Marinobacter sp. CA1]|uniref:MerR family transcriptional regulator n=1 Tax=Marinobacter sp. CA1 TaxID=2817656 RepID=UPI001D075117|nr:MerR family DNA-binding protein [Marinobacter sp. CA1]UDL05220.1 MerR family DNA-binding protein [Marinobacter sp. CA1]
MKVNELAKAAGTSSDTVRYYTREGLLNPSRNPANNYQQFDADDLRRLRFARKARQLGFSLPEIKTILHRADDHHSPCPMVREVFEQRLDHVEQEIAKLLRLRDRMQSALKAWQAMPDGTPDGHTICQLIEHWDDADGPATASATPVSSKELNHD